MIDTLKFGEYLKSCGHDVYTGVPCSWLKNLINYAYNDCNYYNAANEGDAVAFATGSYLAGKEPIVLMQSSGLGNAISPLSSLNYIFKIPVLVFVSLREGSETEPQHELMYEASKLMVNDMKMKWSVLAKDYDLAVNQISYAHRVMNETSLPYFFFVEKETFSTIVLKETTPIKFIGVQLDTQFKMHTEEIKRYDALKSITKINDNTVFVSTTGMTSRELYDIKDVDNNFYMVGSMGCAAPIGLGIASSTNKKVIVIDGDGASLMRLSAMPMVAQYQQKNLCYILLNNYVHDSTGGQTTLSFQVDWTNLYTSIGLVPKEVYSLQELESVLEDWHKNPYEGLAINVTILPGSKEPLGRPAVTPQEVKQRIRNFLKS